MKNHNLFIDSALSRGDYKNITIIQSYYLISFDIGAIVDTIYVKSAQRCYHSNKHCGDAKNYSNSNITKQHKLQNETYSCLQLLT